MKHPPSTWQASHPAARTDRLTPVHAIRAVTARRPITLRLPRVRQVILRDPVDQVAADTLDAYLRHGARADALVRLVDTVVGGRRLSQAATVRVDQAAASALEYALRRLRPAAVRADHLLSAAASRCVACTATEVCTRHQDVLFRWWDLRDQAAVTVVNAVVAAMTTSRGTRPRAAVPPVQRRQGSRA